MVTPFQSYIENKTNFQWSDEPEQFPLTALSEILLSPDNNTPPELLDTFFYVDEMSDDSYYDSLHQFTINEKIDLSKYDNLTTIDLAIIIWLNNPELLQRLHAGRYITKARKFDTFFARTSGLPDTSNEALAALENDLNDFFQLKRKGRGTRVFVFSQDDGLWFLIRHGSPIKRESTITDEGDSKGIIFRPEIYDVLNFLPDCGELQIHASTIGEKKIYCNLIGTHIFGDGEFFIYSDNTEKFTLQPFCRDWRNSLICSDIDGIESVVPIEVRFVIDEELRHTATHKADNLFDAFEHAGHQRLTFYNVNRLTLRIKFSGDQSMRNVTLCTPCTAIFERDSDSSLINLFLKRRGFILNQIGENHDIAIQQFADSTGNERYSSTSIGVLATGHAERV
ncbi:MAG: hypothetical protein LBH59_10930 [Planctomycetaceae bacterium]|nr:hypothetical protein [Planctomycetaceae bacterium]